MNKRVEKDAFGEVEIDENRKWGVQTQRSIENFSIGIEKMPIDLIRAYAYVKKAAAETNKMLGILDEDKSAAISLVCSEILDGKWDGEFPLSVWQTGSRTQTNMNINEVIANLAYEKMESSFILTMMLTWGRAQMIPFPQRCMWRVSFF